MLDKAPFQKGSAGGLLLCCFAFSDPERDARHAKQKPQRLKKKKKKSALFSSETVTTSSSRTCRHTKEPHLNKVKNHSLLKCEDEHDKDDKIHIHAEVLLRSL